jgi:hypothetical protein
MRNATVITTVVVLLIGSFIGLRCSRPSTNSLKGQQNSHLTFYAIAVDQDGHPLQGATFEFDIERIPADWTFSTRGKPHEHVTMSAVSGSDGKFQPEIVGHILRLKRAERTGYRHFYEMDPGSGRKDADNSFVRLDAWGDPWYRSDPEHPAVYVFVKDGVKQISVLPTRGGSDTGGGTRFVRNEPIWPRRPSLPDVAYVAPATRNIE